MRIVVDGRPLVGERSGIGVHTAEIASRLEPRPLLAAHAPIVDTTGIGDLEVRVDRAPLGVIWQQASLPRVLEEEKADVLWAPHGTIPLRSRIPAVVTMHDLTSITAPLGHKLSTVLSFNLLIGRSLAAAEKIAAVSRFTAMQVALGFGIDNRRIEIVPNGVGPEFRVSAAPLDLPNGLEPGSYILFTGTMEPRKGLGELLEAWRRLAPRPRLVIAGGRGWGLERLRKSLERHEADGDIVMTGYMPTARLADLYRGAALFVYPSRDEGFGLPPLEAMACGTTVVATRAGAIPEVTGEAALLVPPADSEALHHAMKRALESDALRQELRAAGLARAALFSWESSAALMSELLAHAAFR
jgi:glycosyltransferase involved in cell wall biosynthesis